MGAGATLGLLLSTLMCFAILYPIALVALQACQVILLVYGSIGVIVSIKEGNIAQAVFRALLSLISFKHIKGSKKMIAEASKSGSGKAFKTGKEGEEELARLVGGKSQQYRRTSLGGRYIDQLSADKIAHESKVGYTTLTKRVKLQILKDAELISSGEINGAYWHFFTSGVTGKGGASQPLLDFLTENGISYIIH